jgi:flagellar motility protein MotE (MotC chaperone)
MALRKSKKAQQNKTPRSSQKKSRSRRRNGRGILWLIAICFVSSGALRIGGNTGHAIAESLATEPDEIVEEDSPDLGRKEIEEVLTLLRIREDRVAERENVLADKEQALEVARIKIEENLVALRQAETNLERMIALSSSAAEDDLTRLTTVYENMKPKQAAALFSEMAPEFAAGFLGRMRADAAAAIMAGLDPQKAYTISVLLAGRNSRAPTE